MARDKFRPSREGHVVIEDREELREKWEQAGGTRYRDVKLRPSYYVAFWKPKYAPEVGQYVSV